MNARTAVVKIDVQIEHLTGQRVYTQDDPETGKTEFTEAGKELFRMLVDLQGPMEAAEPPPGQIALGGGRYRLWSKNRNPLTGKFEGHKDEKGRDVI